jgi:hypothetical protein
MLVMFLAFPACRACLDKRFRLSVHHAVIACIAAGFMLIMVVMLLAGLKRLMILNCRKILIDSNSNV